MWGGGHATTIAHVFDKCADVGGREWAAPSHAEFTLTTSRDWRSVGPRGSARAHGLGHGIAARAAILPAYDFRAARLSVHEIPESGSRVNHISMEIFALPPFPPPRTTLPS